MATLKIVSRRASQYLADITDLVVFFAVLGLAAYMTTVFIAYVFRPDWLQPFRDALSGTIPVAVGVPCAAVGAFALVVVLLRLFPPPAEDPERSKGITFKAFSLEFSGPAGPTTLWLACFLSLVVAQRLLATS